MNGTWRSESVRLSPAARLMNSKRSAELVNLRVQNWN